VEVSKPGVAPSKAQSVVVVVPGMPAIVNVPAGVQMKLVNPKEGVTIAAVVTNVREGCHMWWSVLQEPGHEYFSLAEVVGLGDTVLVTLEEANDVQGRLVVHVHIPVWSVYENYCEVYSSVCLPVCPCTSNNLRTTNRF
jgi:hypothetical protein